MRTALWLISVAITDLSASILKVSGMWEDSSGAIMSFFVAVFVVFAVMDIIEFAHKVSK